MISILSRLSLGSSNAAAPAAIESATPAYMDKGASLQELGYKNEDELRETIYDYLRTIRDPEKPSTLEDLKVVYEEGVFVKEPTADKVPVLRVEYNPTVPHCSLATLIGLCIRVKIERSIHHPVKLDIYIKRGTHDTEDEINRQINDKERIAAAMENPNLRALVENCIQEEDSMRRKTTMAPEAVFTNNTDRNDFMKFTKFLALKGVQIIVHSRKGLKVETNYKMPSSETDWFNLAIQDSVEVTKATKNAFLSDILQTFQNRLCVEISLKTSDGDEMVLETWIFGINPNEPDYSLKAMSTVYYRMGILLKSLISVTRITPAYKLARRQSPDSYSIYYQVYCGAPKMESLGEDSKKVNVGMLRTPIGGVLISLVYRTNMIIRPNKQKNDLLLKSDHFELSPKRIVYDSTAKKEEKEKPPLDLNKPLRTAAFVDTEAIETIITSFHEKMPRPKSYSPVGGSKMVSKPVESSSPTAEIKESCQTPVESPPKRFSWYRSENDPPLQLLHCPFADRQPIRELAEFYRDFFNAPRLKLAEEEEVGAKASPEKEAMEESQDKANLSKEFEDFESSAQEFDEMIASICYSNDEN